MTKAVKLTNWFLYWFYAPLMRLAHRYDWHYAPRIGPLYCDDASDPRHGSTQLWCKWCGFRMIEYKSTIPARAALKDK